MELDPQSRAVLDAINASGLLPFRQFGVAELREKVLAIRAKGPTAAECGVWQVSEHSIPSDGAAIRVRVLRPRPPQPDEAMPAVLYYHGGGFIFGGVDETEQIASRIALESDAVVFNVDYRLAPESKFPAAVNDAYAALRWVSDNASILGIDRDRIAVAGDSAGGNLAAVMCLMSRENKGPRIGFQVAIYPGLDTRSRPNHSSRSRLGGGDHLLNTEDIEWMRDQYLNGIHEATDWRASPILTSDFAGLPPTLVVTASHDPLVDEGKLYADRLAQDGVETEYICFEGTFHGFIGYASAIEVGARGLDLVCDRIKQVLTDQGTWDAGRATVRIKT